MLQLLQLLTASLCHELWASRGRNRWRAQWHGPTTSRTQNSQHALIYMQVCLPPLDMHVVNVAPSCSQAMYTAVSCTCALCPDSYGQTCTHVERKVRDRFTYPGMKAVRFTLSQREMHV